MRTIRCRIARVSCPVTTLLGRGIQATWYALAEVARPVLEPFEALAAPFASWGRRQAVRNTFADLVLVDQLDDAGPGEPGRACSRSSRHRSA